MVKRADFSAPPPRIILLCRLSSSRVSTLSPRDKCSLIYPNAIRGQKLHDPFSLWRLSNTMETDFCVTALKEAPVRYGKPGILNTDQGSQFTSIEFTQTLLDAGVEI